MKGGLVWRWQTQKLLYWPAAAAADALKINTQLWGKPWMNYCTFSTQFTFFSFFFLLSILKDCQHHDSISLYNVHNDRALVQHRKSWAKGIVCRRLFFFFFIPFLLILFLFFIVVNNNSFWLQLLLWNLGNKTPPARGPAGACRALETAA